MNPLFDRLKQIGRGELLPIVCYFAGGAMCITGLVYGANVSGPPLSEKKQIALVLMMLLGMSVYMSGMIYSHYSLQRRTDARLRGLTAYVEKLRDFSVKQLDALAIGLDEVVGGLGLYEKPERNDENQPDPPDALVPTEPVIERPLSTKERKTLLTIIAAMAKDAKLPIDPPGKTALYIEGLTDILGAHVSKRAIEEHLKKIPDALEIRMK